MQDDVGTCNECGASTSLAQLTPFAQSFKHSDRKVMLCAKCAWKRIRRRIILLAVLAVVFVVFSLIKIVRDDESTESKVVLILIASVFGSQILMIVVHELFHAAAGKLVGLKVSGIAIGNGPPLFSFQLRSFRVEINSIPVMGLCYLEPSATRSESWRFFMAIGAGPLCHVLVIAVILGLGLNGGFWNLGRLGTWQGFWIAMLYLNLASLVSNLIPRDVRFSGRAFPSDGKLLLGLLRKQGSK